MRLLLSQRDEDFNHQPILYFKMDNIKSEFEPLQKRGIELTHEPQKIYPHEDVRQNGWLFHRSSKVGR